MSLKIIKAGILDTIQDLGRLGYQSSGINPGGVMDHFSARLANCLLGKEINAPVIEMHFPASAICFEEATIICITGADFSPAIDNYPVQLNRPIIVNKGALLEFRKPVLGRRCYLSILQSLQINKWLNSYSTNLKAEAGGFDGRCLRNGDVIKYDKNASVTGYLKERSFIILSWKADPSKEFSIDKIEVIEGKEWDWLTGESKQLFETRCFKISALADRMGYRLTGQQLQLKEQKQLVSSGVTFGTLQLLPNGQLIVLMADHQTTGGYPRIANVISAHLPFLAQMKPNDECVFRFIDIETAEQRLFKQHKYLLSVQHASSLKFKNLFHDKL